MYIHSTSDFQMLAGFDVRVVHKQKMIFYMYLSPYLNIFARINTCMYIVPNVHDPKNHHHKSFVDDMKLIGLKTVSISTCTCSYMLIFHWRILGLQRVAAKSELILAASTRVHTCTSSSYNRFLI